MPTMKVPAQSFKGPTKIIPGVYSVRMDGFEQDWSQKKTSINLNPILKIVNNQEYFDRRIKEWLNNLGGWTIIDFSHCFAVHAPGEEDPANLGIDIPGEFQNMEDPDPKKWRYVGPLIGRTGQIEVAENGQYINVKRYLCAIPGCNIRHSDNLLR